MMKKTIIDSVTIKLKIEDENSDFVSLDIKLMPKGGTTITSREFPLNRLFNEKSIDDLLANTIITINEFGKLQ